MKNILVVGATGNLGPHIIKALVNDNHNVSALLRSSSISDPSKTTPLTDQGVTLIEGSLEDVDSLECACQEKDTIISCAGADQIMNQIPLAKAATDAGVERFVPSEFGLDTIAVGPGSCDLFDAKIEVQKQIRTMDIGFTPIYTNGFMEFWATGFGQLGPQSPPEKVQVYGDGNTQAQITALADIGRYTSLIIDDPKTLNNDVLISTNNSSQNEMISLWQEISGKTVEKEQVKAEELDQIINTSTTPESFLTRIFSQLHRSMWIRGESTAEREGVLNAVQMYPQVQPLGLRAYYGYFTK